MILEAYYLDQLWIPQTVMAQLYACRFLATGYVRLSV